MGQEQTKPYRDDYEDGMVRMFTSTLQSLRAVTDIEPVAKTLQDNRAGVHAYVERCTSRLGQCNRANALRAIPLGLGRS